MGFLTEEQARELGAICDRILPSEGDGPSAREAHVLEFIDRQLAGPWGQGERLYLQPPFLRPEDEGHGWQLPLTPAQAYVDGLDALDRFVRTRHGVPFSALDTAAQDDVVAAWAAGELDTFGDLTAAEFFALVRQNVAEGLFSDPVYGGNHGLVGWRWLGYPGVAVAHGSAYADWIERHGEDFVNEPRSLAWRAK